MILTNLEFYSFLLVENVLTIKSIKDVSIIYASIYKKNDYEFRARAFPIDVNITNII